MGNKHCEIFDGDSKHSIISSCLYIYLSMEHLIKEGSIQGVELIEYIIYTFGYMISKLSWKVEWFTVVWTKP